MTRRLRPRSTALALLVALFAVGPPARAATFSWAGARLWSYTARYAITGAAAGSQTWQVRVAGATTLLTVRTSLRRQSETDRLALASHGLAPLSVNERLRAPGALVTIVARVTHQTLGENAVVNGRREHVTYAMAPATFVNEALLAALSGAPWRPGVRTIVRDIIVQHATVVRLGVSVGSPVPVRTPAGRFTCLPLTLSSVGGVQTVWIATGRRPVLVRYENGHTTFTLTALRP